MNVYLNELSDWSLSNHMMINERKTKEMVITSSRAVSGAVPELVNIERVDVFKLLGVYVSSDLKWSSHITYVSKKSTPGYTFSGS